MAWEADVKIAGPVGSMGQRVLQPIINQQVGNVLAALEAEVQANQEGKGESDAKKRPAPAPSPRAAPVDGLRPSRADPGPRLPRAVCPARIVLGSRDMSADGDEEALVAVPFRVGVMQLTMEPLDEMLASARAMDEAGMDTIWLAEAYPWWRKHRMEARSSTVVSALMARETTRLTIGWGIISPFTRHPVQVAMDARVVQEAAGPGRFLLGFGTSKIFLNNIRSQTNKTLGPCATR